MSTAASQSSAYQSDLNLAYVWRISTIAALGGVLFGCDWVVIGGAKPFFERFFEISDQPALSGWVNSCALVGCLVGALAAGMLSDRFGRKWLLVLAALLFIVTSLGNAAAATLNVFIAWRILGGLGIGLASSLSPMYISEVSPAHLRGRLVSVNQLTIVIGILGAQLLNWWLVRDLAADASDELIRTSWYGQSGWRWMFALTAVPAVFFFVGMLTVPESPRWLAKNGRPEQARRILQRLGGNRYASGALAEIESTLVNETERVNFRELVQPGLRRVLAIGIALAVFQQWCGINVIFNYAENILKAAGYGVSATLQSIVWIG